ncbi:MAG TPA: DUF11 domain-containing protein [Chloroflexia bacterium]|nr:DUF11 domain-containing protein [Chloroflexia bacterium]
MKQKAGTGKVTAAGLILTILTLCALMVALAPSGAALAQTAGPTPTPAPTETPSPVGRPDLTIHKTVEPPRAPGGTLVTFTIVVTNRGTADATEVVVDDNVPGQLIVQSASTTKGTAAIDGNHVTVAIGTMAPGEVVTITITAVVRPGTPAGMKIVNHASVHSSAGPGPEDFTEVDALQTPLPKSGGDETGLAWGVVVGALLALIGAAFAWQTRRARVSR